MTKVLIVDDSKLVLTLLSYEISEQIETEILTAETYHEAAEIIEKESIHAAILDINLPDAPDGEVIDLALDKNIPVIVLTASMNDTTRQIVLQKEILEFVSKNNQQSVAYAVAVLKRVLQNYETNVLVVDDSKLYQSVIKANLEKLHVNVFTASNAEEALKIINDKEQKISLALIDYEMPGMNGMDLTMKLRSSYSKDELAIIALSSSEKPEIAEYFLKHGANDFIYKPFTDGGFLVRVNGMLDLIDLFKESRDRANKDFMTGAYNRRYFFESGETILKKQQRKQQALAVVMLDIDHFKKVNDTYGHDVGDIAIKEIKHILDANLRVTDLVARFGGEEFCILLEEISVEDLEVLLERIRKAFESNVITAGDVTFSYTTSIGAFHGLKKDLDEMIKVADNALYEAKEGGRNRVVITAEPVS
jgi:diguanylate cyclase (GGDEF)-like protein